jgi:outer membrane usher protein FimD/PapC
LVASIVTLESESNPRLIRSRRSRCPNNWRKPTKGWPVGKYRLEIYVNDELTNTLDFTIEAGKSDRNSDE